ncbi:MAG: ArsR/SmtB family transcription factor [Christensenellales bacterium]
MKIYRALADETRLRILSLVWQGELCVCEIVHALKITQSNASKHLAILREAGFITGRKRAQWMYYAMNEAFCREHAKLCGYLRGRLRVLPGYRQDRENLRACKMQDLCGCAKKRTVNVQREAEAKEGNDGK